jgi:acyl carrier protein phosphodiesterase
MNYLAHIYLSGENSGVILGNFIADHVKGRRYLDYQPDVQRGILLHRKIDSFTDSHPEVFKCKELLRPEFGRWSGIVTDVFFDHFLAANWNDYSALSLSEFVGGVHSLFFASFRVLPFEVKQLLPFLVKNRRLESYARIESIREVLGIMSRRTSLPAKADFAIEVLEAEYRVLHTSFTSFFQDIMDEIEANDGIMLRRTGETA